MIHQKAKKQAQARGRQMLRGAVVVGVWEGVRETVNVDADADAVEKTQVWLL